MANEHSLSDDALRLLIDSLPVGAWTTDRDLVTTWVSEGMEMRALGLTRGELLGTSVRDTYPPGHPASLAHQRALEGESVDYEADFAERWFRCRVEPLRDDAGEIVGTIGIALDISDRKRSEDMLRFLSRGYQTISEITSDFAFSARVLPDGDLYAEWVTESFEQITGFSRAEANALGILTLPHPEELPEVRERLARVLEGDTVTHEFRIVTRGGDVRWLRTYVRPERDEDGTVIRVFGAAQDITDRRDSEQKQREMVEELRRSDGERMQLLVYLVHAQEEERKRIAEGLHDETIQSMVSIGLRLEALTLSADEPAARRDLEELRSLVESSVGRLRTLLFELAPPALQTEGLGPAIAQLLDRVAAEHPEGLDVDVDDRLGDEEMPAESGALAYRIAQEAVTNIRKHAAGSRASVLLERRDGGLLVEVRDDGIGFDPAQTAGRPGHLGLAVMRERAEMARGWFELDTEAGGGTTIRFWLPLHGAVSGPA